MPKLPKIRDGKLKLELPFTLNRSLLSRCIRWAIQTWPTERFATRTDAVRLVKKMLVHITNPDDPLKFYTNYMGKTPDGPEGFEEKLDRLFPELIER